VFKKRLSLQHSKKDLVGKEGRYRKVADLSRLGGKNHVVNVKATFAIKVET